MALCLLAITQPGFSEEPKPYPGIEFGVEQRVRSENTNNVFDYSGDANDEREQLRFRTRAWAKVPLNSSIDVNVGLNAEFFRRFGQNNQWDEILFETANIHIKKLFIKGLSLKVGRQDMQRGEGFLILEGTPGDGSRTTYFNAAVLAYAFRKSTIEAIGILNPRSDRFLPLVNDQGKVLQPWDEQAIGAYYTDRNWKDLSIEAYYFHKKEIRDRTSPASAAFRPDRRVETAGGRVVRTMGPWSVTAEAAEQWGWERPATTISAWGGYAYVKRTFAHKWKPYALAGFWALSGDDPATPGRNTGWDPLFSRWPKWGDLELYSAVPEAYSGYATNQKRLQIEAGGSPSPRFSWRTTYYRLTAFHPSGGSRSVFGSGLNRGQNFQGRLDFVANSYVRGHVVYETLLPGDFYARGGRSYFLRFEITAAFKGVAFQGR